MSNRADIIASINGGKYTRELLEQMAAAGATMFRCNLSHMSHKEYLTISQDVRDYNRHNKTKIKIEVDLQGHRIRVGELPDEGMLIKEHGVYRLMAGPALGARTIPVDDPELMRLVKSGDHISFGNRALEGEVATVHEGYVDVRMQSAGTLYAHKSINIPRRMQEGLTDKDKGDIAFLKETGADWVAASFVSTAADVEEIRALLGREDIKIMSKIERAEALPHLDDIAAASDGLMVARGDLGVELPYEDVPFIQHDIISAAHRHHKTVVVATQMLYSLLHATSPTRAEVSDVVGALREGADGVLLSDETTIGEDPVNSVAVMKRIVDNYYRHEGRKGAK